MQFKFTSICLLAMLSLSFIGESVYAEENRVTGIPITIEEELTNKITAVDLTTKSPTSPPVSTQPPVIVESTTTKGTTTTKPKTDLPTEPTSTTPKPAQVDERNVNNGNISPNYNPNQNQPQENNQQQFIPQIYQPQYQTIAQTQFQYNPSPLLAPYVKPIQFQKIIAQPIQPQGTGAAVALSVNPNEQLLPNPGSGPNVPFLIHHSSNANRLNDWLNQKHQHHQATLERLVNRFQHNHQVDQPQFFPPGTEIVINPTNENQQSNSVLGPALDELRDILRRKLDVTHNLKNSLHDSLHHYQIPQ